MIPVIFWELLLLALLVALFATVGPQDTADRTALLGGWVAGVVANHVFIWLTGGPL